MINSINLRIQQITRELDNSLLLTKDRKEKLLAELQRLIEQRVKYYAALGGDQHSERVPNKGTGSDT